MFACFSCFLFVCLFVLCLFVCFAFVIVVVLLIFLYGCDACARARVCVCLCFLFFFLLLKISISSLSLSLFLFHLFILLGIVQIVCVVFERMYGKQGKKTVTGICQLFCNNNRNMAQAIQCLRFSAHLARSSVDPKSSFIYPSLSSCLHLCQCELLERCSSCSSGTDRRNFTDILLRRQFPIVWVGGRLRGHLLN